MKTAMRVAMVALLFLGVGLQVACPKKKAEVAKGPAWVAKSSYVVEGDGFYGVGLVAGVKNPALARKAADNRARVELARMMDTYITGLLKDYSASVLAGAVGASEEDQFVSDTTKTVTEKTLVGVMVEEHYEDPQTGVLYSLARLPFEDVMAKLKSQVSTAIHGVRVDAANAMKELDEEIEKRRQREASLTAETIETQQ